MSERGGLPSKPRVDRRAAADAIDTFLRAIGRDDPATVGTGERVTQLFVDDLCAGYAVDTAKLVADSVIAVSSAKASRGSLVIARDIPLVTTCPHHLLPAIGTATVGFEAKEMLVGLGTVAALVDAHARRLALQEDIGEAVVDDLVAALTPTWVGCRLVLAHGCMVTRGERPFGAHVETVAFRGGADRVAEAHAALGVGRGAAR